MLVGKTADTNCTSAIFIGDGGFCNPLDGRSLGRQRSPGRSVLLRSCAFGDVNARQVRNALPPPGQPTHSRIWNGRPLETITDAFRVRFEGPDGCRKGCG